MNLVVKPVAVIRYGLLCLVFLFLGNNVNGQKVGLYWEFPFYNPVFVLVSGDDADTVNLKLTEDSIVQLKANDCVVKTVIREGAKLESSQDAVAEFAARIRNFNPLLYYFDDAFYAFNSLPSRRVGLDNANVIIRGRANLNDCIFMRYIPFDNITFRDEASFTASIFEMITDFGRSIFQFEAYFDEVQFNDDVQFVGSTFNEVTFSQATISAKAIFDDVSFGKELNMNEIHLGDNGQLSFLGTKMPELLLMQGVINLKQEIDLTKIAIDSTRIDKESGVYVPHKIALYKSDISKFRIDYRYFQLALIDMNGRPLSRDEAISLYDALLKNFKDRGQVVSAIKLDLEYQEYKSSTGTFFERMAGRISKLWWNYGYEKDRVFKWAVFFLAFFTICTVPLLPFLQRHVYAFAPLDLKLLYGNPYRPLTRLIWYSLVYTSNLFFRITLKTDQIIFDSKFWRALGTFYIIVIYVAGIVCLAYMANFVLQSG